MKKIIVSVLFSTIALLLPTSVFAGGGYNNFAFNQNRSFVSDRNFNINIPLRLRTQLDVGQSQVFENSFTPFEFGGSQFNSQFNSGSFGYGGGGFGFVRGGGRVGYIGGGGFVRRRDAPAFGGLFGRRYIYTGGR